MDSKIIKYFVIFFLFITVNCFAAAWEKSESILDFKSHITINRDASIDVDETITVFANQQQILHGLMRELPVRYRDSYGVSHHTYYTITKIQVDGQSSKYHTQNDGDNLKIYIGDKNISLPVGQYTYTIVYHVPDAINFLKDADELYWNITGNNWTFPIEKASTTIILPQGSKPITYSAYTGAIGAKGNDFSLESRDNIVHIETTKTLQPGEGLTVAVALPKDFVLEPTWWQRILQLMSLDAGQYLIFEIALILTLYYSLVWYWYGRDIKKGTIVPLFEPPNNLSPSAVRYIERMSFDTKNMSAAILSMAQKGYLTIEENDGDFTLKKTNNDKSALSDEEISFANNLFGGSNSITLEFDERSKILKGIAALKKALTKIYMKPYFVTNTVYLLPAWLLTILAFATAIFTSEDTGGAFSSIFTMFIWAWIILVFFKRIINNASLMFSFFKFSYLFSTIFSTLFCAVFLLGGVAIISTLTIYFPIFTIPFLLLIVVMDVVFYYLMRKYTPEGRKLADKIAGFKMFLGTTEKYHFEQLYSMQKTPALFEKYLPYAVALGVETHWADQFADVLNKAQQDGHAYQPAWYVGPSWNNASPAAFPMVLASTLTSSLSNVSSSDSASGGGGSSGGGGGGGGGGGW